MVRLKVEVRFHHKLCEVILDTNLIRTPGMGDAKAFLIMVFADPSTIILSYNHGNIDGMRWLVANSHNIISYIKIWNHTITGNPMTGVWP